MNGLKRGALIVVEGVDKSGKSTQCKKLVESLKSHEIKANLITFPDRTTSIGGIIDNYLKKTKNLSDEAIHLMFCANRWEKREEMEKLLQQGITLIVDRYSYSGIVYSSIKKNMSLKWCQEPEKGLLKPDLILLLTLSEEESAKRPNYGNERYEDIETQKKVAKAFLQMSKEQEDWEIVEADGSLDQVHDVLLKKIVNRISEVGFRPIESLDFRKKSSKGIQTLV